MKYMIIDTETTGLDSERHEMIAFGAIILIDGIKTAAIDLKIKPERLENASPEALEINGYSERRWKKASTKQEAVSIINHFFNIHQDAILVGHNIQFDIKFLRTFYPGIKIPYPYIDTINLARPVLAPYGLQSMSLDSICEFLGWKRRNAHTALSDCEDCAKLLLALSPPKTRFLLRLKAMKTMRDIKALF